MRYALIAILLGAALALADGPSEPTQDDVTEAPAQDVTPTTAPADEAR